MFRIGGERIRLDLDGPSVEVEPIRSDLLQFEGLRLLSAFVAAGTPEANYAALVPLYDFFIAEAQPQWDFVDHRGPVPTTPRGLVRLGSEVSVGVISIWLQSFGGAAAVEPEPAQRKPIEGLSVVESDAPSAVDAVIPDGPANREIKRRLRAVKAA